MEKDLLELLVQQQVITKEQASEVREEVKHSGQPFKNILLKLGFTTEEAIARARANDVGMPYIDVGDYLIQTELVAVFPEDVARKYSAVPLFKIGNILTVAMVEPQDIVALDHIRRVTQMDIESVFATSGAITKVLDVYYGSGDSMEEIVKDIDAEKIAKSEKEEDLAAAAEETPIIKLVNLVLVQAVKDRTSDIHINPEADITRVRYRIDGALHEVNKMPKSLHRAIVSRIKVLSGMDLSESRRGQDGRMKLKMVGKELDVRVSTFPTIHGENVVMRLLDKSSVMFDLHDLGFPQKEFEQFTKLIHQPNGIVLVTGPTGSGKTTTLYSALSTINTIDKNIITIEDPVEYELPLIRQSPVNVKAGITFASGLRQILRQDPDVVMIGEIRDQETAGIAIQASLTGHLVFSTLHTNDAPSSVTRLMDMGIEPFLISSSVIGILAQRLVRRICPECKVAYDPEPQVLHDNNLPSGAKLYKGKGCDKCKGRGFKGRFAIYELMMVTEEIRKLIDGRKPTDEIRHKAVEQGMQQLRQCGMAAVQAGNTSLEEVLHATKEA